VAGNIIATLSAVSDTIDVSVRRARLRRGDVPPAPPVGRTEPAENRLNMEALPFRRGGAARVAAANTLLSTRGERKGAPYR